MREDDIRNLEEETRRRERENEALRERREQDERAVRERERQATERAARRNAASRLLGLVSRLHATAHRLTHLRIKRRFKEAQARLLKSKNETLANYNIAQTVLRLSPLLLYPAAYGMNCLFLAFISRFYALELVLGNAVLKPYQPIIVVLSIFLIPLFLLWVDVSLQSQWVAARGAAEKAYWFSLAAIVCLMVPAVYIFTAWLNRDVNAGETEASMNNVMLMVKGAVGLVVNILILLGGHLLHEGKSLFIYLTKSSGIQAAINWLDFRVRRAQTRLVETFNEFSQNLTAYNSPWATDAAGTEARFQVAFDLPTRRALREQFGYDVIEEPNNADNNPSQVEEGDTTGGTTATPHSANAISSSATNDADREDETSQWQQQREARQPENFANAETNGSAAAAAAPSQQTTTQTGQGNETNGRTENNTNGECGVVFDGNGEDEVRQ